MRRMRPAGADQLRSSHRGAAWHHAAVLEQSLYSAFGQSEVSIIYTQLNQYYVVMEVAPPYWQSPDG
jgi:multidrug efflux pump